jgi:hypothetical protein
LSDGSANAFGSTAASGSSPRWSILIGDQAQSAGKIKCMGLLYTRAIGFSERSKRGLAQPLSVL